MTDGAGGDAAPEAARTWGRWFGRPGHSLTRRLIWLASAWIVVALVLTGWTLTTQYKESALLRLGNMLSETIDEVVIATNAGPDGVVVAEIRDAQTERAFSGKYWAVAELDGEGGVRFIASSPSLAGERLAVPPDLPDRLRSATGTNISYNDPGFLRPPLRQPLRVAASLKSLPGRAEPLVFMAA
ncbi:MAG TPA: sensor histidine kinase, partial [Brevundimonas sp.]|nr:sensor histidine kinase [Brevundimonas sp.]